MDFLSPAKELLLATTAAIQVSLLLCRCGCLNTNRRGLQDPSKLVCNDPVVARLPPQLGGAVNPYFLDTPPGYFAGLWYETYTSVNDSVLAIHDVQLLSIYNETSGVTSNLASYLVSLVPHRVSKH